MELVIKVAAYLLGIVLFLVITVSTIKSIMRVNNYRAKEFETVKSGFKDWDSVLANPGNISIETLHTGDVTGTIHGIINMKNENAAGLEERKLIAPMLSHLVKHENMGHYLIDAGFDSEYNQNPWGHFEGILKKGAFKFSVEKGSGIDELLGGRKEKIKGVFCTHFHEHQGGAPALPDDIPFIYGKGEKEIDLFPIAYARFLKDKTDLREIDFEKADDMPILGRAADIFRDGSFWAISTPGHTGGHVSYLINGKAGRYFILGDVCMCRRGFELGVESGGKYALDLQKNKESFGRIKKFLEKYPDVKPVFGHESDEFPVSYED